MLRSTHAHAGDAAARDALLVHHLRLVHHVARRIYRRIDDRVEYDELVSAGTLGLTAALDSFDSSRRVAFATYAIPRIRGAILDELRRVDVFSRGKRRRHRAMTRAHDELTRTLSRAPAVSEQAAHLGVDTRTLLRWQSEDPVAHVPLDAQCVEAVSVKAGSANMVIDPAEELEHRLSMEQEVAYLRDAMLRLREQERVVLTLYYYEELKLKEIAAVLGVTESRVSQIRARALAALRAMLEPFRDVRAESSAFVNRARCAGHPAHQAQ